MLLSIMCKTHISPDLYAEDETFSLKDIKLHGSCKDSSGSSAKFTRCSPCIFTLQFSAGPSFTLSTVSGMCLQSLSLHFSATRGELRHENKVCMGGGNRCRVADSQTK